MLHVYFGGVHRTCLAMLWMPAAQVRRPSPPVPAGRSPHDPPTDPALLPDNPGNEVQPERTLTSLGSRCPQGVGNFAENIQGISVRVDSGPVDEVFAAGSAEVIRTALRAPWANAFA